MDFLNHYFIHLDRTWFKLINQKWTYPYLDSFFTVFTNLHHQEIFLYVIFPFLLAIYVWKFKKRALIILSVLTFTAFLSDSFSYRLLKSFFHRPRPNQMNELQAKVRVPYSPQSPSFPSNHALTGFALARTLVWFHPATSPWVWGFVALLAYSRVYVGVHFPSDVLGGALIGYFFAYLMIRFFWSHISLVSRQSLGPLRMRRRKCR